MSAEYKARLFVRLTVTLYVVVLGHLSIYTLTVKVSIHVHLDWNTASQAMYAHTTQDVIRCQGKVRGNQLFHGI